MINQKAVIRGINNEKSVKKQDSVKQSTFIKKTGVVNGNIKTEAIQLIIENELGLIIIIALKRHMCYMLMLTRRYAPKDVKSILFKYRSWRL